jgi:hypothetical protein
MDFSVITEALRAAAAQARRAGEQAAPVDPAGPLAEISAALPGSRAGAAAGTLAEEWADDIAAWAGDVRAHGDHLDQSAPGYDAMEDAAVQALTSVGRPLWR